MDYEIIDCNTFFGAFPRREIDLSKETLVGILQKHKVKKALTVSAKGIFYDYILGNKETLEACKNDDSLVPVATIDPRKYYGKPGEIENLVNQGFGVFRLFPDLQAWPLDYAPFYKFLEELKGVKKLLIITANALGMATKIASSTKDGGYPVILTSVSYWNLSEVLALAEDNPHIYLETHLIDSPDGLEVLREEIGADRLIFGSNSPFTYFSTAFLSVKYADISEEDKAKILGGNILKLLEKK